MAYTREWLENLGGHLTVSPASIEEQIYDVIEGAYENRFDIVDATSPFTKMIEMGAATAAGCIYRSEILTRRQHPELAQVMSDLFYHMSDRDHLGVFSSPLQNVPIWLGFGAGSLRENAVFDPAIGMRKVTIPADTTFTNGGFTFFLHWPVDIFISNDNQITAKYDLSKTSPVKSRASNICKFRTTYIKEEEYFYVILDVDQLSIVSQTTTISDLSGSKLNIVYEDTFYFARVFMSDDEVSWTEVHTTHAENYNSAEVTAVVKVDPGMLSVSIPEIYISAGKVQDTIRVDILTTKGKQSINLSDYPAESWKISFNDFSNLTQTYSEPLQYVGGINVVATETYSGGSNGMTFDQVKQRVVYNLYDKPAPYNLEELRAEMDPEGYRVARQKDVYGERIFVASNSLSAPNKKDLSSGAGVANAMVTVDARRNDIILSIKKNGKITTVKPSGLFKENNSGFFFVNDQELKRINAMSARDHAELFTESHYYYTPFHYVLDDTLPVFETRAYHLAKPTELNRSFIRNNNALGYIISSTAVLVAWDEDTEKYTVTVEASVPGNTKGVRAVLNYTHPISGKRWDIVANGVSKDTKTQSFKFEFGSALNISKDHYVDLTGMSSIGGAEKAAVRLEDTEFDLVFIVDGAGSSSFDSVLARYALTGAFTAVSHEKLNVSFGQHLPWLYARSRPIIEVPEYEVHPADVPLLHDKDVYEQDALGSALIPDGNGGFTLNKINSIGDPVYVNGQPVYLYRKDAVVMDLLTGQPKIKTSSVRSQAVRIMMLDAAFRFASVPELIKYRDGIPKEVYRTLVNDIATKNKRMLEETYLYYEPISTRLTAKVQIENQRVTSMRTDLRWRVTVVVTEGAYSNIGIRQSIEDGIRRTLKTLSDSRELSMGEVYRALQELAPNDVRNVTVDTPLHGANYASLLDDNAYWSIAAKYVPLSNGQLDIIDDITVVFLR